MQTTSNDAGQMQTFAQNMALMLKSFADAAAQIGWSDEAIEARNLALRLELRDHAIAAGTPGAAQVTFHGDFSTAY